MRLDRNGVYVAGRRRVAFAARAAVALIVPSAAGHTHGAQATPGQAEAPPTCELHIWPAEGIIAVRQRASESMGSSGGVLEGVLKRTQAATAEHRDAQVAATMAEEEPPLATARQIGVLRRLPLNDFLGITAYRSIVHDVPLTSREIRTMMTTRYNPTSTAKCYADLVVDDLIYSREYARGRKLKSFLRYRDFGTSQAPLRSFATLVETKLELFSLDPPVMTDAAKAELLDAFSRNLRNFAALAVKQPTRSQSLTTGKE